MGNKLNQLLYLFKGNVGLFLSISFGVFLFILFFQPFPLDRFDFNNKLIYVAGFGAIVFLFMASVRILFSLWLQHHDYVNADIPLFVILRGFIPFVLSSVAFAFYLRFVGGVRITFPLMLKVSLICMAAPVVLRIYDIINNLRSSNESLVQEKKSLQKQVEKYEENYLSKSIEFISENNTETLKLLVAEVAFIRSADNYVEIVYREAEAFKKKLIRNTMKNIEQQIKEYSNFIRCHRTSIVNSHFIEKLEKSQNNQWIIIKGYNEKIPVSRQYLLKVKEII
jgi:DNA-binding LytR/AlgR family response regulator